MLPWHLHALVMLGRRRATICYRAFLRCASQKSQHWLLPSSSAQWHRDLKIDHDAYQMKLGVISKRLKQHLKQQKWPRLTHVEVDGWRLKLPIRFEDLDPDLIAGFGPIDEEYLAGFFDGDGCVAAQTHLSGTLLRTTQSAENCRSLLRFLIKYGGSICLGRSGYGSASPTLVWSVFGEEARRTACILRAHCFVKKEQLGIAVSWPSCRVERKVLNAKLGYLKTVEPSLPVGQAISWSYLAGFFDAEGCISMDRASKNIRLEISQRDAAILKVIQDFIFSRLASQDLAIKLYGSFDKHALVSTRTSTTAMILKSLLDHGLQWKRPAALHALRVPNSSHSNLRRDLGVGKGKQSYFEKLNEDGCARAREIKNINAKLWYAKGRCQVVADKLQADLQYAKLEHKVLTAQSQILKLRSFISFIRKMIASPCSRPHKSG